ncbi:MAG TPA: hypothetical protein VES97_08955, partial [Solirubrobacteraceae bacterium]|nr:hypothetical protein [Solirubrobacteraceae bacterium]
KRTRRGSLIAPEEPGQQLSRDEFQELVRDLDVEGEPANGGRRAGVAQRKAPASAAPAVAPERDPAADLAPEDLVLKEEPKRREKKRAGGRRNKRHGRSR